MNDLNLCDFEPGQTQTRGLLDERRATPGHQEGDDPQLGEGQHPVHPRVREGRLRCVRDVCEGGRLRGQGSAHPADRW